MSETPSAKKLPSPRERLDLILLGLARREPATDLCKQAGVSRELFYRWMRAVREAGLKALEAKLPGPKRIKAEKAPKEALRLRDRVERMEKENKALRKERDHLNLVVETSQRIIRRNAWGTVLEPKGKKKGMRNLRRGSFMPGNGPRSNATGPGLGFSPGAGELPEARTGDGSVDAGALPDEGS
jgi:transposase-like protein